MSSSALQMVWYSWFILSAVTKIGQAQHQGIPPKTAPEFASSLFSGGLQGQPESQVLGFENILIFRPLKDLASQTYCRLNL